jgi:hypothetical protein
MEKRQMKDHINEGGRHEPKKMRGMIENEGGERYGTMKQRHSSGGGVGKVSICAEKTTARRHLGTQRI